MNFSQHKFLQNHERFVNLQSKFAMINVVQHYDHHEHTRSEEFEERRRISKLAFPPARALTGMLLLDGFS